MKRHIAVLLALCMAASLMLNGCGRISGNKDKSRDSTKGKDKSISNLDLENDIAKQEAAAMKKFSANFIGRFDFSDSYGPVSGWPGSTIQARFKGTSLKMIVKPTMSEQCWLNIIIDKKEPVPLCIDDEGVYTLVSGLEDKEHEITIWKRLGGAGGEMQFLGFVKEEGVELLPPPKRAKRRIEFIGDSIVNGYGIEAASSEEGYKASQENNYLAFGSVAARELDAEQIAIAWGGRGVYQNNGGDTRETMPFYYTRTLPHKPDKLWDFKSWIPQAVVINLGTNDFSNPGLDKEAYVQTYKKFIKFIKGNYPKAHVFCVVGPMDHREKGYVKRVVNELSKQGDKKVHYIQVPLMDTVTEGVGGNGHPSVKTQARVGKQVAKEIRKVLGW